MTLRLGYKDNDYILIKILVAPRNFVCVSFELCSAPIQLSVTPEKYKL